MSRYAEERFKRSMRLKLDFNNMMTRCVGEHGISEEDFIDIAEQIEDAEQAMAVKRANGGMDWRELPYNQDEIVEEILQYAAECKDQFEAFVVLGIGGSAMGPICIQQALNHPYYNELPREKRGGWPRFYVADNVDPERLVYLFETIDPAKTLFNVTSKSGDTSETMSQFMIIKELLEQKLGKEEAAKHIVCTTDAVKGNLRPICEQEGYKSFVIPVGVGGRFSELCPMGLLPAAMTGIDIKEMLAGAAYMDALCQEEDTYRNIGYMYAILSYLAMKKGKNIQVMMPYADSLKHMSDWFAQRWAESLGKMNMTLTIPEVNAFTMGELMCLFEVATAFTGELNAFDQPGVEGGKNATYAMFGRPEYEDKKEELDSRPQPEARFII